MQKRLKHTEIPEYRKEMLKAQQFRCPLCKNIIGPKEAVLDHSHKTGHVRGVLHRNCNGILGRIGHYADRIRYCDRIDFLKAAIDYLEQDYSKNATHPTHKPKKKF